MKRVDLAAVAALFLLAFGLRAYDVSHPPFRFMDEPAHVPAAGNYWSHGHFEPDFWEHPPLRHLTLHAFLGVLGDNPWGWRMRNVLFGAIAVALTWLFAREVTGSRRAAAMAGLLLATDPLHVLLSRHTFEEVYGGAFFLAAIVAWVMHRRRSHWLALSALLMGMALATKWYYVPGWLLIGLLTLREDRNYRDPGTATFIVSTWLFIPLAVYTLSYYPWFGRGYGPGELVELTVNAYHSLQSLADSHYRAGTVVLSHTSAAEWFTTPIVFGRGRLLDAGHGEFFLYMNDPPVWLLTLPALAALATLAVRARNLALALPALFFVASYSLFLLVDRPAFLYSAAPLLPFAFTAIGYGAVRLSDRFAPRAYYAALAVLLLWTAYLYPLVTATTVPLAPYRHIVDGDDIGPG